MAAAQTDWPASHPIIKGTWLDGSDLVYHCREYEFTRWYANGERVYVWSEDVDRWEVRTRCGLLLDWWTEDSDAHGRYTTLDGPNAAAIARPCRKCWAVED